MNRNEYDILEEYEEKNWWFIAKKERLKRILLKKYIDGKKRIFLDIGCGGGIEASILQDFGKVMLTDNEFHALDVCKRRGFSGVCASGEMLPFKEGLFDSIFAIDVIEHIKNDSKAIREWHSLCPKGGSLFVTTSAFQWLYNEHDQAVKHFRRYGKKELKKKLEAEGFEVVWMSYGYVVLFIPLAIVVVFNKFSPIKIKIASEKLSVKPFLNTILLNVMRLENALMRKIPFPFGTALLCEARKK